MSSDATLEIAAHAARLVVEEGMEYGPAKQRALRDLGLKRAALPGNDLLEDQVREYIDLFCADTQPAELHALREVAVVWMVRLTEFRPHLTGAVWRGTATRLNVVHLQLYCDDPKSAEIRLLDQRVDFDVGSSTGPSGDTIDVLSVSMPCAALGEPVTIHLSILDHDDLRGGLKPDARGQTERGDLNALRARMAAATLDNDPA